MAKRTKLKQDNLRKIAVSNAINQNAIRQASIKNPSGGSLGQGVLSQQATNQQQLNSPISSLMTNTDTDNYIKQAYSENPEYWSQNLGELKREAINRAYGDIQRINSGRMTKAEEEVANKKALEEATKNQELAGQLGQENIPQDQSTGQVQIEEGKVTPIDYGQALTQGAVSTLPSTLATAGAGIGGLALAGGAIGSVVPIAGTAVGAAIGAGIGTLAVAANVLRGVLSNIKKQKTENINAQRSILTNGQTNLRKLVMTAKSTNDVQVRADAVSAFNTQLERINSAYSQIKLDTQNDLLKFEDATEDLQAFENFYSSGGAKDYYVQSMNLALVGDVDEDSLNQLMLEYEIENGN